VVAETASDVAFIAATRTTEQDLQNLKSLVLTVDAARLSSDFEQFLRDDHSVRSFLVHMIRNPLWQDAADLLLLHTLRFWRFYWKKRPVTPEAMRDHLLGVVPAGPASVLPFAQYQRTP
jgi:DNA-binding GntR family transcriptional regulator